MHVSFITATMLLFMTKDSYKVILRVNLAAPSSQKEMGVSSLTLCLRGYPLSLSALGGILSHSLPSSLMQALSQN